MSTTESARRVWRWFAMQEDSAADNTDLFAQLVTESPVVHFPGLWVISRHDLVAKFSNHPGLTMVSPDFPAEMREENPDFTEFFGNSMSVRAPEDHRRLRGVLAREFTGRSVERLREKISHIIDTLLAGPTAEGGCEFVSRVAVPLPSLVTAALLDLPEEDWAQVTTWSRGMLAQLGKSFPGNQPTVDAISVDGFRELRSYVESVVRERDTLNATDVISRLNAARRGGQLSHDEVVNMVLLLFMTGVDTVTSGLTNALLCLLTRPAEWQRVAEDPGKWAAPAFAESIRLRAPVTFGARIAAEDLPIGNVVISKGEIVLLAFASANLDPRRFEAPLEFRWDRTQNAGMSFGHGAYFCLGAGLGSLQSELLLARLAQDGVALAQSEDSLPWRRELTFNSPAALPVRLGSGLEV